MRVVSLVLTLGLAFALALAPAVAQPADTVCDGFEIVPFQGPSCPVPGGWQVLLRDGTSVFTHGPDDISSFAAPAVGMANNPSYPVSPPICAAPGERHVLAVYGHPFGAPDRYLERLDRMREMISEINGHLRVEAATEDADMSYRFRCDGAGLVHVEKVNLPTDSSVSNFGTILGDMRDLGYDGRDNAVYLMFYEGNMGNIGGQGQWCWDDRLVPDNCNTRTGSLAINYGYFDDNYGPLVLVHENGHNLGAVQMSAPHSSGGAHCNDGWDTMCYADGGSTSDYDGNVCGGREWLDCNHDDYFDPAPAPESYLATHWNLAHPYNVYFDHRDRPNEAPIATHLGCVNEPSPVDTPEGCGAVAFDPDARFFGGGGNVSMLIDWGDGTSETLGPSPPGTYFGAFHQWPAEGTYTITATPTDDGSPPLTGAPRVATHRVACASTATGQLLLGLAGQETPLSARTVPVACAGQPYTLTAKAPNDLDVCWMAGTEELRCDRTPMANETGLVPEGATHARIMLTTGAQALYRLRIGA